MRVLTAMNATAEGNALVSEAAARPWPVHTRFLLLHVVDPFSFSGRPLSLERAEDEAWKELEKAAETLRKAGWPAEINVKTGRAREEIAKIAANWKADLILVGTHGGGALQRALLGSTARTVLRQAHCSVEIVRPVKKRKKHTGAQATRLLVTTDGSEFSAAAIRAVAARAWPKGSVARVISIPEPFVPLNHRLNTSALKDAQKYADAGADALFNADLKATAKVPFPESSNGREIVKEAERWHADLIVMGSHGRRGFDRWFMGSVSEYVALHAPCSVEVIRMHVAPNRTAKESSRKAVSDESHRHHDGHTVSL